MKLDEQLEAWANDQRSVETATLGAQFKKLGEELGELGEALLDMGTENYRVLAANLNSDERALRMATLMEIADCGNCLSILARTLGAEGLYELMQDKFEILLEYF